MSRGGQGESSFGFCNLLIKFALFVMNFIIWLLGCVLLAAGIYTQVESETLSRVGLATVLTSPGIVLIVLGGIIFLLGFCGCLGALREIFILLVIYSIIMSVIVVAIVGLAIYVYVARDQARAGISDALVVLVENYNENVDLQNIVDFLQGSLLQCCGVTGPNDWQRNIYFNCCSIAFQRCSVPFSCCMPAPGEDIIINVQCGYRALSDSAGTCMVDGTASTRMIYETGCLTKTEQFINQYLYVVLGVVVGLLIFMLVNILLASGLAVDVHREKKALKAQSKQEKREKRHEKNLDKI